MESRLEKRKTGKIRGRLNLEENAGKEIGGKGDRKKRGKGKTWRETGGNGNRG